MATSEIGPQREGFSSRRQFVGGLAFGALGAIVPAAAAQTTSSGDSAQGTGVAAETPDYPRPPFEKQPQEWPGLASPDGAAA